MPKRIRTQPVWRQYVVKWQLIAKRPNPDMTLEMLGVEQFHEVTATSKEKAKELFLSNPPNVPEDCALVSNAYLKGNLPCTTYTQIIEKYYSSNPPKL